MKGLSKVLISLFLASHFGACTPIEQQDYDITATGSVSDITSSSAIISGYANLPLELGDANYGIIYSTATPLSPETSTMVLANFIDSNNMYVVTITSLSSGTTYYYSSFVKNGNVIKYGEINSFSTTIVPVESVEISRKSYKYRTFGGSLQLLATVLPEDASDKSVRWSSSDISVASVDQAGLVSILSNGTAVITVSTNDNNKTATCELYYDPTIPEGIDLGLSVKWAPCNLGAETPEDVGDYYAWGETHLHYINREPLVWKNGMEMGYDWTNYKWGNGDQHDLKKYNTDYGYGVVDNKTELEIQDDAARANLGGNWRIPTYEEWLELRYNCTWSWDVRNGISGHNVKGPNGNSIFLPAGGYLNGTYIHGANIRGDYWSSTLSYWERALNALFNSEGVYSDDGYRYEGKTIRPVSE